ncbi:MAG: proton-conducting transporter membrane subunit, partial [bacterium]
SLLVAGWPELVNKTLPWEPYLVIDGLTRVFWPYATLIAGVLLNFSRRYMAGNHRMGFFYLNTVLFLGSVLVLSATNHLLVLLGAWVAMGVFMSRLIGHKSDWPQALAAGKLAQKYFLTSSLYVAVAVLALYTNTGNLRITAVLNRLPALPPQAWYLVVVGLLVGAVIQSSLFPVQNWLMSSMTAPTPASALMHAGFVNVGGILLSRFAPVFTTESIIMIAITLIGATSAVMGKIWKMVQTAIKRQLACSTIAQMGFMLVQCGLGYFTAAVTHLILHGFYKGYLFLNSGNAIHRKSPHPTSQREPTPLRYFIGIITSALAAGIFMGLTGKGLHANSGIVLVFIVVLTVIHGTREIVNRIPLPRIVRYVVFPLLVAGGATVYSLIFNGVTALMSDLPAVVSPTPFTWYHGLVMLTFTVVYIAVETWSFERFEALYVYVLNASQPHHETIVSSKEEYHV